MGQKQRDANSMQLPRAPPVTGGGGGISPNPLPQNPAIWEPSSYVSSKNSSVCVCGGVGVS